MSSEYTDELLTVIAKELQKKFRYMNEVHRLTAELGEALSSDDKVVARMILEMRGKELENVSGCEGKIRQLLSGAPESLREKLEAILDGKKEVIKRNVGDDDGQMWTVIENTVEKTIHVWRRTVELDKAMGLRLAGKDSYYNQQ